MATKPKNRKLRAAQSKRRSRAQHRPSGKVRIEKMVFNKEAVEEIDKEFAYTIEQMLRLVADARSEQDETPWQYLVLMMDRTKTGSERVVAGVRPKAGAYARLELSTALLDGVEAAMADWNTLRVAAGAPEWTTWYLITKPDLPGRVTVHTAADGTGAGPRGGRYDELAGTVKVLDLLHGNWAQGMGKAVDSALAAVPR